MRELRNIRAFRQSDTERGWTVVDISRGGTVDTNAETVIEADDEVLVAGSDETIRRFEAESRP